MDHLHAAAAPPRWTHPKNWWATPLVSPPNSSCHIYYSSITLLHSPSLDFATLWLCSFSFHYCLGWSCPSLVHLTLPLSHFSLTSFFSPSLPRVFWLPTLYVKMRQESHGSAAPITLEWASLFVLDDTFINGRSTRPCSCSITSAGASRWGAQHVRCVSACACARVHLCALLPLWFSQLGLWWS